MSRLLGVPGLLDRLVTEYKSRGATGFLRFLTTRIVQWRADLMFDVDLPALAAAPPLAPQAAAVLVSRHNLGSEATRAVEHGVLTAANHAYREALAGDDMLLATTDTHGQVISYAFVLFDSFYKRVLGEAPATPMISNCYTDPAWRGQGLYPRLLVATCLHLANQGHARAIITCAPDNLASVRGIEKAGFRRVKTLHSLVVLARWIAWQRSVPARAKAAPGGAS